MAIDTRKLRQEVERDLAAAPIQEQDLEFAKRYADALRQAEATPPSVLPTNTPPSSTLPPISSPLSTTKPLKDMEVAVETKSKDTLTRLNEMLEKEISNFTNISEAKTKTPEQIAEETRLRINESMQLTARDREEIERRAQEAGAEFDPLIEQAREASRLGKPKALISAGEVGGFMNTQFSGASAILPTEGGTFAGQGGEVDRVNQIYDKSIEDLRVAKLRAIQQAKALAEQAILTKKESDYSKVEEAIAQARAAQTQSENLALERVQRISGLRELLAKEAPKKIPIEEVLPTFYEAFSSANTPEEQEKLLESYSLETGLSPITLSSGLLNYEKEQQKEKQLSRKETLEQLKSFADLGGKGKFEIEGYGTVDLQPTGKEGDFQMVNEKGNFFVFNKKTGELKKSALSAKDITPSALTNFDDYVSSSTVSINKETGVPVIIEEAKNEQVETFEEFLARVESSAKQSLTPDIRANLKAQYDEEVKKQKETAQKPKEIVEVDISMYHPRVQSAIKGLEPEIALFQGGTQDERERFEKEIKHAKSRGIQIGLNYEQDVAINRALSNIPTQLRNAIVERSEYRSMALKGLNKGISDIEVANDLMGWNLASGKENKLTREVRDLFNVIDPPSLEYVANLSRLANSGNYKQLIIDVENRINEKIKQAEGDNYISEQVVRTYSQNVGEIATLLNQMKKENKLPVGVLKGSVENFLRDLKGPEATKIKNRISSLLEKRRNDVQGTTMTAGEKKIFQDIEPRIDESLENFLIKLQDLSAKPLRELNNQRGVKGLPPLSGKTLMNWDDRAQLYMK